MPIPVIKHIHLLTHEEDSITEALRGINKHIGPVVIHVEELQFYENEAISVLEKQLAQETILNIPYPIYVQTSLPRDNQVLSFITNSNEIPLFFKQKEKAPNVSEANLNKESDLRFKHLKNFNKKNIKDSIVSYSISHKELFLLSKKASFTASLLQKLKKRKIDEK